MSRKQAAVYDLRRLGTPVFPQEFRELLGKSEGVGVVRLVVRLLEKGDGTTEEGFGIRYLATHSVNGSKHGKFAPRIRMRGAATPECLVQRGFGIFQ